MNVDEILKALNDERVDCLLIGGMNFCNMLACQDALPPPEQKARRMEILREAIRRAKSGPQ